ncbi:Cys-tRNA(Pro) deacylase [Treponema zuelzerae]|uniref:Cys-tRNA(Pro)/Cys-tRNA(Cys) deacylase n=1 Tax=Teretinema zuelzerae TaxID=156 RepID=A0AAE3EIE9_9SPIR|nr:Cys-tRNA(Pro) deacylase [Teretinema zuelzerae]MBN2810943.1 Cys-tRNA(Pro) deacylase [Spirochaetales bacterium]MCD1655299.1 Cys-tRNA(Pro) deacylase [Teretinema zuelzerae]HPO03142.1 Cys-tRNA(Pro) deacylase [Treponemataceae bacterium]
MAEVKKTNPMRILEARGIPYGVSHYEVDEDALDAETAARKLGVEPARVFKTIVMRTDQNEICVFCVPADSEVNLKKARAAAGSKEIAPVKPAELLGLTGYIRGGCSPLGMKKRFRTFIDETAILHETVYVSAGIRGTQLVLDPGSLLEASSAVYADLTL